MIPTPCYHLPEGASSCGFFFFFERPAYHIASYLHAYPEFVYPDEKRVVSCYIYPARILYLFYHIQYVSYSYSISIRLNTQMQIFHSIPIPILRNLLCLWPWPMPGNSSIISYVGNTNRVNLSRSPQSDGSLGGQRGT